MNNFRIVVGERLHDCTVEMNGLPLKGVCRISFDLNADQTATMLHLEIMGEIFVEGEFRDDAILQVRQPHPAPAPHHPSK